MPFSFLHTIYITTARTFVRRYLFVQRSLVLISVMSLALGTFAPVVNASTVAPPNILTYQGRLTDASGNLLGGAGTSYYLKFSIWDSPTVGAGNKLWPVGTPATTTVTVTQGVFTVNIGDTANGYPDPLNLNFANNSTLYLQVEVSANNISSETLSPRQQLTSVPFAQVAGATVGTTTQSLFGTTTPIGSSFVTIQATSSTAIPLTLAGAAGQSANVFQIVNNALSNLFSISSSGVVTMAGLGNFNGGFLALATSTVGNGTQIGGLTISGGATTTANAYFGGALAVGTTTPTTGFALLVHGNSYASGTSFFGGAITATSTLNVLGQATFGNASTTAISGNTLAVGGTGTTSVASNGTLTAPNITIGSLGGLLKATAGVISAATLGTDYVNYAWPFTVAANGGVSTSTLVQFNGNASSTQLSSTQAYFGGTATSTFLLSGTLLVGTTTPITSAALFVSATSSQSKSNLVFNVASTTGTSLFSVDGTGAASLASLATLAGGFLSQASSTVVGTFTTSNAPVFSAFGSGLLGTGVNGTTYSIATSTNFVTSLTAGSGIQLSASTGGVTVTNTIGYPFALAGNATTSLVQFNGNASSTQLSATTAYFGGTATSTFTSAGFLGFASSTPWGQLSVNPTGLSASAPEFVVGSSTQTDFIITQGHNVGIGTTTPQWNLQVAGTRPSLAISDTNAGANLKHWLFSSMGGNLYIGTSTDSFSTTTTALFSLLNNGNVGIGTTSPSADVAIQGQDTLGQIFDVSTRNGGAAFHIMASGSVGIGTTTPSALLTIATSSVGSTFKGQLDLSDTNAGANLKHWLFSSMGGNLYIGTSTDAYATSSPSAFAIDSTGSTTVANGINIKKGCFSIGGTCLSGGNGAQTNVGNSWTALQQFNANASTTQLSVFGAGGTSGVMYLGTSNTFMQFSRNNGNGYLDMIGNSNFNGVEIELNGSATNELTLDSSGNLAINGGITIGSGGYSTNSSFSQNGLGTSFYSNADGGIQFRNVGSGFKSAIEPNSGTLGFYATSSNNSFLSGDQTAQIFGNGDWLFQQGGTYTDNGNKVQITGNEYVSGNIGIATATPNWSLQVAGTRPSLAISDTNAGANLKHWLFSSMGGNLYIGTSTDAYATSSPANLTFLNNGRVGIGTSSPSVLLSVAGSSYFGSGSASTFTIQSGIINHPIQSTTTIPSPPVGGTGVGVWNIATSTAAAASSVISINSNAGTTTISFFGATTTGLTAGTSPSLNGGYRNGLIIGNGKVQSNVTIANGSLCVSGLGWCTASSTPTLGGSITARNFNVVAAEDLAEMYVSNSTLQPGDIVAVASSSNAVTLATATSTDALMGAVSTDPAITLGLNDGDNTGRYAIALAGQVPVFVNLDTGPIYPGDRIAVSNTPGVGRKAGPSEASVGIALGSYTQVSSSNTVLVFMRPERRIDADAISQALGISEGLAQSFSDLTSAFGELAGSVWSGTQHLAKVVAGELVAQTAVIGNLFAQHVFTQQADVGTTDAPAGITLYDTATHAPYCLTITNGSPVAAAGACGSPASAATTTPPGGPTITLMGASPAQLHVGDIFSDPGATAQDTAGHNLDVRTYLNGVAMNPIQIDTSTSSVYEIEYSAADGSGNTATTTRSVVVQ